MRTAAREDYLMVRCKRLLAWCSSCGVAQLPGSEQLSSSMLPHLCTSRLLSAGEFHSLVATCRGHCRVLARPEVLEPLLRNLDLGFREMRGLGDGAGKRLAWLEQRLASARDGLKTLSYASLAPLRTEMRGEVRQTLAHAVLEPTAILVGDTDCAGDDFAARCLLSEGAAFLVRAAALKPERVPRLKQRRFRKAFTRHREAIKAAASDTAEGREIYQKLGCWLQVVEAWYEHLPLLLELFAVREAIAKQVLPLAAWALRPHLAHSLGRLRVPNDPPDAVLKDPE
ncbi:unnamed protein product, partial [Effrenium voratum]